MNKELKQFYTEHSESSKALLSEEASKRVKENIFSRLGTAVDTAEPVSVWSVTQRLVVRGYILAPLLVVIFIAGTSYASADALPGDLLYPVKLEVEHARLLAAPDDEAKTELQLNFAQNRINELEEIEGKSIDNRSSHSRSDTSTSINIDGGSVSSSDITEQEDQTHNSTREDQARAQASKALEALKKTQSRWEEKGNDAKAQKMQQKVEQFRQRFEENHDGKSTINQLRASGRGRN